MTDYERQLFIRAFAHIEEWHQKYGRYDPDWLPPANSVRLMEDIAEAVPFLKQSKPNHTPAIKQV